MRPRQRTSGGRWFLGLDKAALWRSRGEIVYERLTPGVKKWLSLLGRPGVPRPGPRAVVCLSGRAANPASGGALCRALEGGKDLLWVIVLDDLARADLARLNRVIGRHVPRTFDRASLRQAWDAYMLHSYLHELGHARFTRRGRAGLARHEQEAERFAWRYLERLVPPEIVARVLALHWIIEAATER